MGSSITKIGGDIAQLSYGSGAINDENGLPIISTDTEGGQSYILGPTMIRAIVGGVANGDFAKPPLDTTDVLSSFNGLPYWDWVDSTSSGRITAKIVADSSSASGNVLRFTAVGAQANDKAYIERYVSVLGSRARTVTYQPRSAWSTATSSTNMYVFTEAVYMQGNGTATTGSSASGSATGSAVAAATNAREVQCNPNTNGAVPTDGAYIRLRVGVSFGSAVAGTATADLAEVRIDTGTIQALFTDNVAPQTYGYGTIYLSNGDMWIRPNETGGTATANPSIILQAADGDIYVNSSYGKSGGTPSSGNMYLTTKAGEAVTVSDSLLAGNMKSGYLTVNMTNAALASTSVTNVDCQTTSGTATVSNVVVMLTPYSARPDAFAGQSSVSDLTFSGSKLTGFTIYTYASGSTDRDMFWLAIGR